MRASERAVIQDLSTVHEDVRQADWGGGGVRRGRLVQHRLGVEEYQVGLETGRDLSPMGKPEALCGQVGHLVDSRL